MKTCLVWTGISVLTVMATWAQGQRGTAVRGEISSATLFGGGMSVELRSNGSGMGETVDVRSDGSFEFQFASPGLQELRVVARNGAVIHREFVHISGGPGQFLSIRVPDPPQANRTAGPASIHIRQLDHKIPPKAQKAFNKGREASAKGNQQQAAEYFQQAVGIDPEFVDAFNELGAAESAMGQYSKAAESFQKAIDLVPDHRLALPNLSIVLAKMKRFREAGDVARRALKVSPGLGRIHYILAASLIAEQGDPDEALANLERAVDEVPKAHLVAADLLAQKGRARDAARHLENYLRSVPSDDAERPRAEERLAQLRQ